MTDKSTKRTFFTLNFDDKDEIKLGRNLDADIRITDISVSRTHAYFRRKNSVYTVEDNSSKFGTLCQLQHPQLPLVEHNSISFQIGKSILNFSMEKVKNVWTKLCCKKEKIQFINYSYLNSKFIAFDQLLVVKEMDEDEEESFKKEYITVGKEENFNDLNYCEDIIQSNSILINKGKCN